MTSAQKPGARRTRSNRGKSASVRRVAIIGGNRIPFARSNGPYADASNQDMLTAAIDGLISRFSLQGEQLGEVAAGAVLKHARDFNLARECVLGSRLAPTTPASDVQMACGTGLQAIVNVANKIAMGQLDSAIAGGVDTTSDAPLAVNDSLRRLLVRFNAARSAKERMRLLGQLRPGHIVPEIPRNAEPRTGLSMGEHASLTAKAWDIGRAEQDEFAAASHRKLAAAYDRGFFDDLLTPYLGLTRDQNLRGDSTPEKLAKLKPVFGGAEGTMTAGNSTPLSDGASTVLLATEEWAKQRKLPVLAYLTPFSQTAAVDYVHGDEGLLMAPAYAVPRMLAKAGLSLGDFDFYEIHEAFASQVLATLKAWEDPTFAKERLGLDEPVGSVDREKLNVNGSSLAAGHPFAATGGRIVATLAKLLNEKGSGRGLISICAAGGQGVTAILEK
ncbi:acetyl-CoA acetyltransferase [Saccharomonospora marina XMU15]|uniref:Acetyl-CoA acetyltransferase n=1 Tax=Saccharomonospora marina XMU15 TaxID=882083 RepID=H5XC11_9PSEU|nr:acetyl-CoA C-acetyltransferase [Saccharomonospora marina]EHR53815.1 acetyl-CoA acetyltransferase [Saccharomonospora marina XMU15]